MAGDAELVDQAREGDPRAYELLVRPYLPSARRTAALVAGHADADDIVQNALLKAHSTLDRFAGDGSFRPWLLSIVTREALNALRSARRRSGLAARLGVSSSADVTGRPSAEEDVVAAERRDAVRAALRELPGRYREVVVCRYLLDLSEAETAATLRIAPGTVKSRLSRALARLRASPTVDRVRAGGLACAPGVDPGEQRLWAHVGDVHLAAGVGVTAGVDRFRPALAAVSGALLVAVVAAVLITTPAGTSSVPTVLPSPLPAPAGRPAATPGLPRPVEPPDRPAPAGTPATGTHRP